MTVRTTRFEAGRALEREGPVVIGEIVLDRPDKRNALTPDMLASLVRALDEFSADGEVRGVVLRGEGKSFCSGFDLTVCRDDDDALGELLTGLSRAVRAMRSSPKPVVAGAHGAAVAGATALLTAADVVVADAACKMGYPVVRLGISPAVSAPTLMRAVGPGRAAARMLDPDLVDGERARELGLIHVMVGIPEDVTPRAHIEATRLATKPPAAFRATKRWLNEVDRSADERELERALATSLALVNADEQRERLAALWEA